MKDIPTIFIVFGVTGDLMKKKIAPALFNLYQKKNLPGHTKIIGFARRPLGDDGFRGHVATLVKGVTPEFLSLLTYNQGNFTEQSGFNDLKKKIEDIESEWGICANKFFYLAVPPESYDDILKHLKLVGLNISCLPADEVGEDAGESGWTRLLIEKPFGSDELSARQLNNSLMQVFKEDQIYRIDHYLGKDGVMALTKLKNPEEIKKITIKLWEKLSVDGRGPFYERVGALRDVGQNHLLSIFSILTGEPADRLKLVSSFRAQYNGYRQVEGVASDSQVETYFKIEAKLDNGPWQGVEIILESGKVMPEIKKEVIVDYKNGEQVIYPLELNKSGQYVAEYEQLLLEATMGERERFLTEEEVESAWRFVDPVIKSWQANEVPLDTYDPGTLPS